MQKIKRVLAALLVVMTILSCNVTGFAAKVPTATLTYQSAKTVKRGKTVLLNYKVKCGSYKKKGSKYHALFVAEAYYQKVVSGSMVWRWGPWLFTGTDTMKTGWAVPKKYSNGSTFKTGKYVIAYGCHYSSKGCAVGQTLTASQNWKWNSYKTTTLKVK